MDSTGTTDVGVLIQDIEPPNEYFQLKIDRLDYYPQLCERVKDWEIKSKTGAPITSLASMVDCFDIIETRLPEFATVIYPDIPLKVYTWPYSRVTAAHASRMAD